MRHNERGQMLAEFLMCLSIGVLLWIVLVKVDGAQNIHNKIGTAIRDDRARLETAYPVLNLSQFSRTVR